MNKAKKRMVAKTASTMAIQHQKLIGNMVINRILMDPKKPIKMIDKVAASKKMSGVNFLKRM